MDKALFENLKQGLKEAAAIRRGKLAPGRVNGNQCARCEINSRKNRIESG
jgi:CRISPR/Cas system-associated exonuclease Cas4 (RecB family)